MGSSSIDSTSRGWVPVSSHGFPSGLPKGSHRSFPWVAWEPVETRGNPWKLPYENAWERMGTHLGTHGKPYRPLLDAGLTRRMKMKQKGTRYVYGVPHEEGPPTSLAEGSKVGTKERVGASHDHIHDHTKMTLSRANQLS